MHCYMSVCAVNMRSWAIALFVILVCFKHSFGKPACPSGEYHPGPECAFEEICGLPSIQSARRHYCDCWCMPPLIRDTISMLCVSECPKDINFTLGNMIRTHSYHVARRTYCSSVSFNFKMPTDLGPTCNNVAGIPREEFQAYQHEPYIYSMVEWLERTHGGLSYRQTQVITGHGNFERYLYLSHLVEWRRQDRDGRGLFMFQGSSEVHN